MFNVFKSNAEQTFFLAVFSVTELNQITWRPYIFLYSFETTPFFTDL